MTYSQFHQADIPDRDSQEGRDRIFLSVMVEDAIREARGGDWEARAWLALRGFDIAHLVITQEIVGLEDAIIARAQPKMGPRWTAAEAIEFEQRRRATQEANLTPRQLRDRWYKQVYKEREKADPALRERRRLYDKQRTERRRLEREAEKERLRAEAEANREIATRTVRERTLTRRLESPNLDTRLMNQPTLD